MTKGLTLARAFYLTGHRVIGADFESTGIPCSGRFSHSISVFRTLQKQNAANTKAEYTHQVLRIIKDEGIDLWVSCSGVATSLDDARAKELIEESTPCKCVQFGVRETALLHQKDSFMREADQLGLAVPQTYSVSSTEDVLQVLSNNRNTYPERKFILKTVDVDDVHRGDMSLLPFRSDFETQEHVVHLPISPSKPWILQEYIPGGEEYCSHSLVVRGEVKCFVACPSAELLMHYRALPRTSPLSRAMLAFTREFVLRSAHPELLTGHLSFDFMVKDTSISEKGLARSIYAIECNPRAHTAVVLFAQKGHEMEEMVEAYISTLEKAPADPQVVFQQDGLSEDSIITPSSPLPRYWIGHDLVSLVFHPAIHWVMGKLKASDFLESCEVFVVHVVSWKEAIFETWDPVPVFALYHIYWTLTIFSAWLWGQRWSRLNVSTTKVFAS
ncbi:hypothetical protein JX265_013401 [Neoarthrinium moseri]|uniref:ATP-grasp domain-containing protein n=1 Tax=Neoarthrinium moseri TaxID=1658444 RepID=A0A9Q0AIN2_9PEZI|nr:uncharacterized protein JN550_012803 [Neoarthrinium moseri]KAI1840905.1 hypothetical protein JX266_012915 [Neoarthrinium moseri]KAI1850509.1 hypothetical protein JX265_013401 [Neoarthrinium moseri]KAI1858272.1 hypothetical protein JN550_012803 [Neoarthrinium moseri]